MLGLHGDNEGLRLSPAHRPRLAAQDKLFWVVVRRPRADWRRHLVPVQPASVVRWHTQAWRLVW